MQQEHLGAKDSFMKRTVTCMKEKVEKILSVDRRGSTVTVYFAYKMLRQKH